MYLPVHIIDRDTTPQSLGQLRRLRAPSEAVVSIGPPPECAGDLDATVIREPLGAAALAGLIMRLRGATPALAHAWSPRAAEAACAAGGPVVWSLPAMPAGPTAALVRRLARRRPVLTVPTRWAKDQMVAGGADRDRLAVLPPAVHVSSPQGAAREAVRAGLGLDADCVLAVACGPIVRDGGQKLACWAHGLTLQILPQLRLLIPGRLPHRPDVAFFAQATGFGETILLPGPRVAPEDALLAADVALFLPSRDVGVAAALEAMAAGVALAATDLPAMRELLVDHPRAARLCAPRPREAASALLELAENPQLARQMSHHGQSGARDRHPQAARGVAEEIYSLVLRQ